MVECNLISALESHRVVILQLAETPIDAAFAQEFLMRALFAQFPVMHDKYLVCALDR